MKKSSSCPSSLQAMYTLMTIMLAITAISCSGSQGPIHDAAVAHLDGGRQGLVPTPPHGAPGHSYIFVPPPPQQRRLLHLAGRWNRASSNVDDE
ncbi:unnamed protein product [Urochloa humidicola]